MPKHQTLKIVLAIAGIALTVESIIGSIVYLNPTLRSAAEEWTKNPDKLPRKLIPKANMSEQLYDFNVANSPDLPLVYVERAIWEVQVHRYAKALKDCDKAESLLKDHSGGLAARLLMPTLSGRPMSSWVRVTRGEALVGLHRYAEAEKEYLDEIKANPSHAIVYYNLNKLYYKTRQFNKQIDCCTRALELKPDWHSLYDWRGDAYIQIGDNEKAMRDVESSISFDPKNSYAYVLKCRILIHHKNEEALISTNKAVELDPDSVDALNWKIAVLRDLKRNDEAIAVCKNVLSIDSSDDYAQRQLRELTGKVNQKTLPDS